MRLYISRKFKKDPDDTLVTYSNTVYQKMTDDVKYAVYKPFVEDIKVKNDAFILGIANAKPGGTDRNSDKNDLREELIWILEGLAVQIERTPNVTARFITDAGFEVRNTEKKSKEPVTGLGIPQNFIAVNLSTAGHAKITWDEVLNALNYTIRYKPKSEMVWQNGLYNDKGTYTFSQLKPDTVYEFEVCALGPNGLISEYASTVPVYVS